MYSVSVSPCSPPPKKKILGACLLAMDDRKYCLARGFDIHNKKVSKINNSQDSPVRYLLNLFN